MAGPLDLKGTIRMRDRASGPLRRVSRSLAMLGNKSGIRAITGAFRGFGAAIGNLGSQMSGLLVPLAALAGLGFGAGIVASVVSYAKRTDDFTKFGRQVGMTAQNMREMSFVADRQGANMSVVKSSLIALAKRTGELKAETGGLYTLLKKTNPELMEQFKNSNSLADSMLLVAKASEQFTDKQERMAFLAAAFSRGGATEMAKFFAGGEEALKGLNKEARFFLGLIGSNSSSKVEAYTDSLANIEHAFKGVGDAIGDKVLPVLTPMINDFARWVASNRELVSLKAKEWVRGMGDAIKSVDWSGVVQGFGAVKSGIFAMVDAVGGLKNLAMGMGALFAAPFVLALGQVAAALVALGVAVLTTPIGFALLNIGLIAYTVGQNWDAFSGWFIGMWDNLSSTVNGWGASIKTAFTDGFNALKKAANDGIEYVKSVFNSFADWLMNSWVGKIAGAIKSALSWFGKMSGISIPTPSLPQAPATRDGAGAGPASPATPQTPRKGASLLHRGRSFGGSVPTVIEKRHASLDINVHGNASAKINNGGAGKPVFDEVRVNKGASMRGAPT